MRRLRGIGILLGLCLAVAAIHPVQADVLPEKYRIEPVARGLADPSGVAFAPDGRIFYLERTNGSVRIIQNGKLLADPFVSLGVSTIGDEGLLGIALHPDFATNGYVYLYYTNADPHTNRVVRYTAEENTGVNPLVIVDNLGYGSGLGEDNGGGLAFGNDGFLYVSVGVMEDDTKGQDPSSYLGKVLKVNNDGSSVEIYASGFRNSEDLAVNPATGTLYGTDEYMNEGSVDCDELNAVASGGDCGWNTEACSGGSYDEPVHSIEPKMAASGVAAYDTSNYPTHRVCASGPLQDCSFYGYCSNDASKPCIFDKVCSDDPEMRCQDDLDCAGTCVEACGVGNTCDRVCGGGSCSDSTADGVFLAGNGDGAIHRDLVSGTSGDVLDASAQFYSPSGADCPTGLTDVEMGNDGWMYAVSDDSTPANAGIYRLIYDPTWGDASEPREVSASQHFGMTLGKNGSGIQFWWEDLKKDTWGCTEVGECSVSLDHCVGDDQCPGGETCVNLSCPANSREAHYTLWKGPLGSFSSHTPWIETNATAHNDALRTHIEADMPDPGSDTYFLVSARGANHEGTTGSQSSGTPRTGYGTPDICDDIGYGAPNADLDRCTGEVTVVHDGSATPCDYEGTTFPDQDGNLWSMEDFRGKTVVLSFMQYG